MLLAFNFSAHSEHRNEASLTHSNAAAKAANACYVLVGAHLICSSAQADKTKQQRGREAVACARDWLRRQVGRGGRRFFALRGLFSLDSRGALDRRAGQHRPEGQRAQVADAGGR